MYILKQFPNSISWYFTHIKKANQEVVEHSLPIMVLIALTGVIGMPVAFLIWGIWFPEPYDNIWLRIAGIITCLPLLFTKYYPEKIRKYLQLYSFVILIYILPFFFYFMLLMNQFTLIWQLAFIIHMLILTIHVSDWILVITILVVGITLAYITYFFVIGGLQFNAPSISELLMYSYAIFAGIVFNRKKLLLHNERLSAMKTVGDTMAHELRTPLLSILSGIAAAKKYMSVLMEGYLLALNNNLPVTKLRNAHLESLQTLFERIELEIKYSNTIIDMLLVNANKRLINPETFYPCSIKDCIDEVFERYPFKPPQETSKIHYDNSDFRLWGNEILIQHILFNLLKNALYSIKSANKGEIRIWASKTKTHHCLHVKDTGTGIPEKQLIHIFEDFISYKTVEDGTGLGLAFCKNVMNSFHGDIICQSKEHEYAEFILYFPIVINPIDQ